MSKVLVVDSPTIQPLCTDVALPTDALNIAASSRGSDGIEPALVARWAEGAIVELVEVTGPSHHADECDPPDMQHEELTGGFVPLCHPDALPDCWHTPVGRVTPVDPIPCERPHDSFQGFTTGWSRPSPVWVADEATTRQLLKRGHRMSKCSKKRYINEVDAMLALSRTQYVAIKHRHHTKSTEREESRVYKCPNCNGWHLTSET